MQISHSHLILDACCIFNFCASGHFLDILKTISAQVAVSKVVLERELKTLPSIEDEESGYVQFDSAIAGKSLIIVDFDSEEEEISFVNYVFELGDDGESATCAIAMNRGWAIATDDKKAISCFQEQAPHLQILSTPEIIRSWSEETGLDSSTLRDVLHAIRVKGHYVPPKHHPLQSWWETAMK